MIRLPQMVNLTGLFTCVTAVSWTTVSLVVRWRTLASTILGVLWAKVFLFPTGGSRLGLLSMRTGPLKSTRLCVTLLLITEILLSMTSPVLVVLSRGPSVKCGRPTVESVRCTVLTAVLVAACLKLARCWVVALVLRIPPAVVLILLLAVLTIEQTRSRTACVGAFPCARISVVPLAKAVAIMFGR